jgi:hypothetical protein
MEKILGCSAHSNMIGIMVAIEPLRNVFFYTASALTLGLIVVLDVMTDASDPCLIIYALSTLIAFVCGAMFADWWRVKGSATSIYKWITILLFAFSCNDGVQFMARYIYLYNHEKYEWFINSVWWQYRAAPLMVALIYLFSFAMWQRFGPKSTYHDGIRQDMANGFDKIEARIVAGEIRFEGHSHDGLILGAKIVIKQSD